MESKLGSEAAGARVIANECQLKGADVKREAEGYAAQYGCRYCQDCPPCGSQMVKTYEAGHASASAKYSKVVEAAEELVTLVASLTPEYRDQKNKALVATVKLADALSSIEPIKNQPTKEK